MSSGLDGGGGGGRRGGGGRGGGGGSKEFFLSTHRCPEVDLLPHHDSKTQIPPPCSIVSAEKISEFTCTGQSEANYLDVYSTCHSEEEEEDGSISDWSEEDLSLHCSPSVILPSDEEEADPESGFECIDVTMETQVKGQEGEGLKMVPKRMIQLKKKKDGYQDNTAKLQVILKDGPAEGGGATSDVSVTESVRRCPDLLLRQHSMPASFHTRSTASSDVDSYRVYRGPVAGASQGFHIGGNARQRLQKSFSLDETKTKMASYIIKSVLSKKMQVEQNNKPREGGGWGETCGGVSRAPVHSVRDMKTSVKNTFSPAPTYQQAVGVKGHDETERSRGHVTKVAVSLSQSEGREQNNRSSRPIPQQGRGSEPIISRSKVDDVSGDQSERGRGVSHQSPPCPPSTPFHLQRTQPPLSAQEQSHVLGVSSQSDPSSSQQILHLCFHTPTALHPPLQVSSMPRPLSSVQLQRAPPAPIVQLLRRSEVNRPNANHPGRFIRTCLPHRTVGDQEGNGNTVTPATQEQHEQQTLQQQLQQQQFLWRVQGFLPAQVGSDFLVDITGSAAAPGALISGPAPRQMVIEPGRYFYVDTPPPPQTKMLLDPETGQYIQVFLPAARSVPNNGVFPVRRVNPAVLSVMPFQPTVAMSSLYPASCLPFTLHPPSAP